MNYLPVLFNLRFLTPFAAADELGGMSNPCAPILLACEDKGYVDDRVANPGQKIWADCANILISAHQSVRGLNVDESQLQSCRKYKASRTSFVIDRR